MIMNNRLLLVLGVTGLAVLSALGRSKTKARRQDKTEKKVEMQRWEGEGGNLPVPMSAAPIEPPH